ncbi:MAG: nitroreductase [Clostridiales bacterium]|nr:nitroreductase [Clostridiales bacterium]
MNNTINDIMNRRSIRKYKPEQITREELDIILQAGICAPTGKNRQSPILIAVQNKEVRDLLSRMNAQVLGADVDPFYGAPTVVVVLAKADSPHAVQDGSLVLGNMMTAAKAIGLGSCWINRAREVFDSAEGKQLLARWGVEGDYIGVGNCILGYPDEEPVMKPRKPDYIRYID